MRVVWVSRFRVQINIGWKRGEAKDASRGYNVRDVDREEEKRKPSLPLTRRASIQSLGSLYRPSLHWDNWSCVRFNS